MVHLASWETKLKQSFINDQCGCQSPIKAKFFFSWSGKLIDTYVHLLNNILATPNDYFRFISNGKCQFRIWLSWSKCSNNKGGRKKKDILHLDILKWYNVFQLCQRFCIKVLYIYCKNAFDDSFMPPSQKWTVLKCQKLTHNSWNPV